jgi:hypothetical protein
MTQADYIRIGKEHFFEVILPIIKEISTQVADNLLVFIEGSVAYGYCDEKSDVDIDFFFDMDISAVNNLAQAISIWDPKNLLPMIKERVGFYPEEMKKSVIRGLWVTVNDSGVYNFKEALNRNKKSEGKIYFYRAIEAILRLTYILNNLYYPPTKGFQKGYSN